MSVTNPDDRELEELLAETAGLKQRYRSSSRDEPPAAIDNALRAAARREVSARPRLAGSPFSGSWRIPLAIAAVVVVSATVTLLIAERDAHLPSAGKGSVSTAASALQAPASRLPSAQSERVPAPQRFDERTDAVAPETAAKARLEAQKSSASPDAATGVKLEMRAKSAARDAKTPEAETSTPSAASEYRQHPFPAQTEPAPAAPGNGAAQPAPANVATLPRDVAARPASAEPPTSLPPSRQGTLRDAGPDRDNARESPGAGAAAKDDASVREAPAAAAARILETPAKRSAGVAADSAPAAEENTRARRLAKEQVAPATLSSEPVAQPWEQDPKAWLKHIEELRTSGLIEDAKASFKTFRSRYPDYPLPAGFVVPGA